MGRRATVAVLAVVASLALANTARADSVYLVEDVSDSGLATCRPTTVAQAIQCDSLRAAVTAAMASPNGAGDDVIYLQAGGNYVLNGPIALNDQFNIVGRGPRTTSVSSDGTGRVFTVGAGAAVSLSRLTVAGGRAGAGDGGNILNEGTLTVYQSRVTGGSAANGGGIANVGGDLTLFQSLVDHNTATNLGGGVLTRNGTDSPSLEADISTIGLNQARDGGGLAVSTTANNTSLVGVTIARNTASNGDGGAGGVLLATSSSDIDVDASLVASNTLTNCAGPGSLFENTGGNRENGTSCGFAAPGTGVSVSNDLVNAGGDTDVFTIPATGGAKNAVAPCTLPFDQRQATRPQSACDAGAFQEGAEAPPISDAPQPEPPLPGGGGTAQPTPTPTPAQPAPTATPSPTPTPVANQTVVAGKVSGTLRIKVKGTNQFVEFDATKGIPLGSEIDARKGEVEITSVSKPGAPPEKAKFHDGIFRVTQSGGITVLTLTERLAACPKKKGRAAAAAAKKPKVRRLWGDGKGKFRTSGKYAAATVRGTEWLVQDSCAGTLVRVKQGTVTVRDNVRKKNKLLRAPKSYLAKPR